MSIASFTETEVEQISKVLGEAASGTDITRLLRAANIADPVGEGATKWRRIATALLNRQAGDRCGNNVVALIQRFLDPVRFVGESSRFESLRADLNTVLAFKGLQLRNDGKMTLVAAASTIDEAEERADRLRAELNRRKVHPDVLSFCRSELVQENYFHAILEATKSVSQKLRDVSGSVLDGSSLVDEVFNLNRPLLATSSLSTPSEKSEQTGLNFLIKGVLSLFRNPTAHEPKIHKTYSEEEALDLLTLVSYLHRRIDAAHRTTFVP